MDRQSLSDALGVLSVVTWLGAQSPQIYENWRSKSVEGLALPFLVSWFAGDFTNFLGCVLTRQLPFQTYLAGYFIVVDVILCAQFAYYSRTTLPPLNEDFPYAQPPSHASSPYTHHRRSRSRKRKSRTSRSGLSGKDTPPYTPGIEDDPMRASWMSETSSGKNSTNTSPRFSGRPLPSRSNSTTHGIFSSPSITTSNHSTVPPSPTVSEERGRTLTRAHPVPHHYPTFDPSLSTIHGSPSTNGAFLSTHSSMHGVQHGSHVSFDPQDEVHEEEEPRASRLRTSSSRSRPPPPSRRNTSVVFLSVGALVTFGTGAFSGGGVGTMEVQQQQGGGRAWSSPSSSLEFGKAPTSQPITSPQLRHPSFFSSPSSRTASPLDLVLPPSPHSRRATFPLDVSSPPPSAPPYVSTHNASLAHPPHDDDDGKDDGDDEEPLPPRGPDWERIIGRASAWICTTAYLTSRLPQLWQNFRRRSCEGLAMTLFLFAFIGNSLYVASILSNPLASTSPGYLLESTPYLLGSGGTLCFDLAILFQSVIYSEKRKAKRERERRRKAHGGVEAEEEAALLFGEGMGEEDDDEEGETRTLRGGSAGAGRSKRSTSRQTSSRNSSVAGGGGKGGRYSSRSVSSGGRLVRPPSTRRSTSNSTEMDRRRPAGSLSRQTSTNSLSHSRSRPRVSSEYGGAGSDGGGGSGTSTPSVSRNPSRARTSTSGAGSSFAEDEAIAEEGESTVTLR